MRKKEMRAKCAVAQLWFRFFFLHSKERKHILRRGLDERSDQVFIDASGRLFQCCSGAQSHFLLHHFRCCFHYFNRNAQFFFFWGEREQENRKISFLCPLSDLLQSDQKHHDCCVFSLDVISTAPCNKSHTVKHTHPVSHGVNTQSSRGSLYTRTGVCSCECVLWSVCLCQRCYVGNVWRREMNRLESHLSVCRTANVFSSL